MPELPIARPATPAPARVERGHPWRMRIAAIGECTIDRYLDLGIERVGGISLNFAVQARLAGAEEVALVSAVGGDAAARVRATLAHHGVDGTRVRDRPGATASQAIHLGEHGERLFPSGGYEPGVLTDFRVTDADLAYLRTFDAVAIPVFRELTALVEPIVRAHDFAPMRVADLLDGTDLGADLAGITPLLDHFAVLFVSGNEATVERLAPHARASRTIIVVTRGAAGSTALAGAQRLDAPALPVPPSERVDTTGCGDAFQAAFTVDYLRHRDIQRAQVAGAARAATVIRHLGATPDDA